MKWTQSTLLCVVGTYFGYREKKFRTRFCLHFFTLSHQCAIQKRLRPSLGGNRRCRTKCRCSFIQPCQVKKDGKVVYHYCTTLWSDSKGGNVEKNMAKFYAWVTASELVVIPPAFKALCNLCSTQTPLPSQSQLRKPNLSYAKKIHPCKTSLLVQLHIWWRSLQEVSQTDISDLLSDEKRDR